MLPFQMLVVSSSGSAVVAPEPGLLPIHSRITFIGDGIGGASSAPGMANYPFQTMLKTQGRLLPTAEWRSHRSGDSFAIIQARSAKAYAQVGADPNAILVVGTFGHNDAVVSMGTTAWLAAWNAEIDRCVAACTACKIIVMTFCPSIVAGEAALLPTILAAQLTRHGEAGGRLQVLDCTTGFDPTIGVHTFDGTHPNQNGGDWLSDRLMTALDPMVTPATQNDILDETSANVAMGLGAIVHISRTMSGTSGTKAGASNTAGLMSGNVATSHTLTCTPTDGSGVGIVASILETGTNDTQAWEVAGTPATLGSVPAKTDNGGTSTLSSSNTTITGSGPGRIYEYVTHIVVDDGAGGTPLGVRSVQIDMVNNGTTGSATASPNMTADLSEVFDYVVRLPSFAMYGSTSAGVVSGRELILHKDVAQDCRIRVDRQGFRLVDILARVPAKYVAEDNTSSGNAIVRLTGTGVVTTTTTDTYTITAATVGTVRLETGTFEGGAITFSCDVLLTRLGVTTSFVGHVPAVGGTADWTGLLLVNDTIEIRVTGVNSLNPGGTPDTASRTYTVI